MKNKSKRARKKSRISKKRHGGWRPFGSSLTPEETPRQSNEKYQKEQDTAARLKDSFHSKINELERTKKNLATEQCNPEQLTLNDVIISFKYGNFPVKALEQVNSIIKSIISLVVDSNFGLTLNCVGPNSTIQSGMCSVPAAGDKKIFNVTEFTNNILHLIPSNVDDIKKLLNPSGGVFGAIGTAVKMTYNVATHASTILRIKQKAIAGDWKNLKINEVVEILDILKKSIIPKLTIEDLPAGNEPLVDIIEEIIALLKIFSNTQPDTGVCNRSYENKTINEQIKKLNASLLAKPMQPAIEEMDGGRSKGKRTRRRHRKGKRTRRRKSRS